MKIRNLSDRYIGLHELNYSLQPRETSTELGDIDLANLPGVSRQVECGRIEIVPSDTKSFGSNKTAKPIENDNIKFKPNKTKAIFLCSGTNKGGGKCINIVSKAGELCKECKPTQKKGKAKVE